MPPQPAMKDDLCAIDGCERRRVARGWCHTHYKRWQVHGDPTVVIVRPRQNCTQPGCDRTRHAHGLCKLHWRRRMAGSELDRPVRKFSLGLPECVVDGCTRKPAARNMCVRHYTRMRAHGDVDTVLRVSAYAPDAFCDVAGCFKKPAARGYCAMHYRRARLYGDPEARSPKYRDVRCLECGIPLEVPPGQIGWPRLYCSSWCQNQRAIARRNRRYLDPRTIEGRPRTEVFERDGWICHLCQEAVDPSLCYPDPKSASIDHVKLVRDGGRHELGNVRTAHLVCNLRRGARY